MNKKYDERFLGTIFYGDGRKIALPDGRGNGDLTLTRSAARAIILRFLEAGHLPTNPGHLWVLKKFCLQTRVSFEGARKHYSTTVLQEKSK